MLAPHGSGALLLYEISIASQCRLKVVAHPIWRAAVSLIIAWAPLLAVFARRGVAFK